MENSNHIHAYVKNHYTKKNVTFPFEVFMQYSDDNIQKQNIVTKIVADHLETQNISNLNILDIGCGTGSLITEVSKGIIDKLISLALTEVDLSPDMLEQTRINLESTFKDNLKIKLINGPWIDVELNDQLFDVVLVSHVFLNKSQSHESLLKMFKHLNSKGILIIVANTSDISHIFRQKFRKLIYSEEESNNFVPRVIEDYQVDLANLFKAEELTIKELKVPTVLNFPQNNDLDFWSIISFLLGKDSSEYSNEVRDQIYEFTKREEYSFSCDLGIMIVSKP